MNTINTPWMTEEDTFRKLKQIPFEQLLQILFDDMNSPNGWLTDYDMLCSILTEHNWKLSEYLEARYYHFNSGKNGLTLKQYIQTALNLLGILID